jgi:hypothetical protein
VCRAARGDEMSAANAVCSRCGAEQFGEGARFCTKCGQALAAHAAEPRQGRMGRFFRAVLTGAVLTPRAGRRAPLKYVWRSRGGILRASKTDGARARGRPRPEIYRTPGLSASAKKVYFYLSTVSDVDGYAFPSCERLPRERNCRRRRSDMH